MVDWERRRNGCVHTSYHLPTEHIGEMGAISRSVQCGAVMLTHTSIADLNTLSNTLAGCIKLGWTTCKVDLVEADSTKSTSTKRVYVTETVLFDGKKSKLTATFTLDVKKQHVTCTMTYPNWTDAQHCLGLVKADANIVMRLPFQVSGMLTSR